MKILLINPPIRDFYNTPTRRQPLGLCYLAAALSREGHDVELLDAGGSRRATRMPLPEAMRTAVPSTDVKDSSPFKLFGRYHHFGPSFQMISERIRSFAPDVIGIASLFTPYAAEAMACAEEARKSAPPSLIVAGGGHPSALPRSILQHKALDYVVLGEGEETFPALLDAVRLGRDPSTIPGVAGRKKDGVLFINPPCFQTGLESFPHPARELLDLDAYLFKGRRMTQILSSRGCPFSCAFCSAHLTSGKTFRPRRPEEVVKEMRICLDRFGIDVFDFEDDNLTFDPGRAERLMDLIIDAFGEETLWLEAMNGISMKGLNRGLLCRMRRAGFRNLNISPLSFHEELRASMDRPDALEEAKALPGLAASLGFRVTAYLMIGYPGQSLSEMMNNLEKLAAEPVLLAPSVFYPAPGSNVQKEFFNGLEDGWDDPWPLMRSSLFPEVPGGLKRRESRTVFWLTRLANFARSIDPDRRPDRLREACAPFMDRFNKFASDRPLDGKERGLAALSAYLARQRPHGIQVIKTGAMDGKREYRVFPLDEMIENPDFYVEYGIPGFKEMLRRPA